MEMPQFFGDYFAWILILIALTVALTIFVFRKRLFDRGYRKGLPKDPAQVKRENPRDEWSRNRSRSH